MEISYDNTMKESIIFRFYYSLINPFNFIIATIIALVFYPWSYFLPINIGMIITLILWILLFNVIFLLFSSLLVVILSLFKKNNTFLTNHKIVLNDENLIEETKYGTAYYKWEGIHKIKENKNYLYIYVSPYAAHIIPKKIFPSTNDYQTFYSYVQKRVQIKN